MTDVFSESKRSWIMSRVRAKDTCPELAVRSLTHRLGYRFRLHCKDLPGKPDLVFAARKKVIFVHGCFWHGHKCARGRRLPKAHQSYWCEKIRRNVGRDAEHERDLVCMGWRTLVIWECQTRDPETLGAAITRFLDE